MERTRINVKYMKIYWCKIQKRKEQKQNLNKTSNMILELA